MHQRLQKILASAGLGSRRECEKVIQEGRVRVNGEVVRELGRGADPDQDAITVDKRLIRAKKLSYIAMYKPRGYTSTRRDPHAPRTVLELLPERLRHLNLVGRLDASSEGLILFTNDGQLANRLTHPRYGVPKTYRATVRALVTDADLKHLAEGVELEDGMTLPAEVALIARDTEKSRTRVALTIREGRNRQIRRMFEALGYEVARLVRVQFGPVSLADLRPGQIRELTEEELSHLNKLKAHAEPPGPPEKPEPRP